MKSLKGIALIALTAMVAVGCNKIEKILPKKDGEWKVTEITFREYTNGGLDTTYIESNSGEIYTFEKDGTGELRDGTDVYDLTWEVNDDNDVVKICVAFFGPSVFICFDNTVLESEKNRQVWTNTDKETGDTTWTESDVTLERVE
jgi:hypothetical protein